jgi:hypothetical protein
MFSFLLYICSYTHTDDVRLTTRCQNTYRCLLFHLQHAFGIAVEGRSFVFPFDRYDVDLQLLQRSSNSAMMLTMMASPPPPCPGSLSAHWAEAPATILDFNLALTAVSIKLWYQEACERLVVLVMMFRCVRLKLDVIECWVTIVVISSVGPRRSVRDVGRKLIGCCKSLPYALSSYNNIDRTLE